MLICSCSGIACCLAVLGAYCDPRLHMPWTHKWPHRPQTLKNINKTEVIVTGIENLTKNTSWSKMVNSSVTERDINIRNLSGFIQNTSILYGLEKDEMWQPVLLISVMFFLYNMGLGSVPFVLVSELFPISVSTSVISSRPK